MAVMGALLLFLPAGAKTSFKYTGLKFKTIQNSGPPSSRIDLVIIGDGYNKEDMATYEKDARLALDELWRITPYKEYRNRFNVHLVMVESHVPKRGKASEDDYAFRSHLDNTGQDMVQLDKSHFVEAAKNAPGVDVVIALTTCPGRANAHSAGLQDGSRTLPDIVLTRDDYKALAHELGHAIGHLGDEYDSSSKLADRRPLPANPSSDIDYPNLSYTKFIDPKNLDSLKKTAKWKHFFDFPKSYPLVSAYQGGLYQTIGVWRPSFRCIMKSTWGVPFCPVCHEYLVRGILSSCGETFNDAAYHRQFPLANWK